LTDDEAPFAGLEPLKDTPVAPAHVVASIALHMAMKYHDIQVVKDGALYQQYKLEGKNLQPLQLDTVLETAKILEAHLLGASERIAKMVVEAITREDPDEPGDAKPDPDPAADERG
jgi:hypothetical protein